MKKMIFPLVITLVALFILYTGGFTMASCAVAIALQMCVATYIMCRDDFIMTAAIGLVLFTLPRFMFPTEMQSMHTNIGIFDGILKIVLSDWLVIAIAFIITIIAIITARITPLGGRRSGESNNDSAGPL